VWFRRDLRLGDNPAWAAATSAHESVIAAFVIEPGLMASGSRLRRDLMLANLAALDADLSEQGGSLVVRSGPAAEAISAIVAESEATGLYLNADHTRFARRRDAAVIAAAGAPARVLEGNLVHAPGEILTRAGTLSQVFTPFYRVWASTPTAEWPEPGPGTAVSLDGEPIPEPESSPVLEPGETAAWHRLQRWLESVDDYADNRNRLDSAGTSELSVDLKFGTLSARTAADVVGTSTPGRQAFVRQLAWRDWYAHTLAERPDMPTAAIRPRYDEIAWRVDSDGLERWATGTTGFPVVDAGMRQLTTTGRMHNRARMICASFLVKDLLIDWREGERFFRHHLLDADVAQNAGNWQWVAGTGPDAAPYFRVFNPTTQGRKFDPHGEYVRAWVPELSGLSGDAIHEPSSAGDDRLRDAGVVLGETYPWPMVDHAEARARALAAYEAVRG
jgi:deoxyribodipyrimidine photo-lyase